MGKVPGTENRDDPTTTEISMFVKNDNITDLWTLDVIGVKDPIETKTIKEHEFEISKNLLKDVVVNEDGRYEVKLPWIENHPVLGVNKEIAMRRLENLVKKSNIDNLYEEYDAILDEWLTEVIVERVLKNEEENWVHYLPHRHVIKENSTTRVRPVFDASAKDSRGISLNECFEKGPNLIELVLTSLLRFKEGNIGVNCRVVFGLSCSPFILGAIIYMHLNKILKSVNDNESNIFYKKNVFKQF